MSIIDTTSWVDAEINRMHQQRELDRRYRLAQEDQALQRQEFDDRRADRTRRLDQERADQNLLGGLWDFIQGNQPGTSQPPQDYTNPVLGPPTQAQMQAPAAMAGSAGVPNPVTSQMLRQASPAGASRFMDDYRQIHGQFLKQRQTMEQQDRKQRVASAWEPVIRETFDPRVRAEAMTLIDMYANTDMDEGDLRSALNDLQTQATQQAQSGIDRQYLAVQMGGMGPAPDPAAVSPNILARERGYQQQNELLGQRQDFSHGERIARQQFSAGQQEDRQVHGVEMQQMRSNRPPRPRSAQITPEQIAQQFPALAADAQWYADAYNGRDLGFSDLQQENTRRTSNPRLPSLASDPVYIDLNNQVNEWEDEVKYLSENPAMKADAEVARKELYRLQEERSKYLKQRGSGATAPRQAAPVTQPTTHMPVVPPSPPAGGDPIDALINSLTPEQLKQIMEER